MKRISLVPWVVVVVLAWAKADTILLGSTSYNGTLTFKDDVFSLTTKKHGVRKFSEGDYAGELRIFFNPKKDGVKTFKGPIVTHPLDAGLPKQPTTEVRSEENSKRQHATPKKCFIAFKADKPALHDAVLLSIDDNQVSVQEDTSQKLNKTESGKKQTDKNPLTLLKADIDNMACKE